MNNEKLNVLLFGFRYCEFQRPFLNAIKEQRRKLKEDNKCQQ